ncbi:MAG: Methylase [Mucilaginibacter sp.]|nr:Methylase [Mucilaginibacter sp.]
MKKQQKTFAALMKDFEYRYDLRTVFDDFLTMAICACSPNPQTGLSHDEDLYLQTVEPYKTDALRHHFPKMFACLTREMEDRVGSGAGNDVLGEFYEQNLYRKGAAQYFTPWPVCELMAKSTVGVIDMHATREPLRIIDPCCGSGRMLLASAREIGRDQEYYGIDIDHTCVKMTALNLFLNGMFHCEVMCSDALRHDDFRCSYKTSFLPFGIFRAEARENSRLWQLYRNSFRNSRPDGEKPELVFQGKTIIKGSQLKLF